MIRGDGDEAITEGRSNQKLSDALIENNDYSESRAMMITRTETAFADGNGRLAAYIRKR